MGMTGGVTGGLRLGANMNRGRTVVTGRRKAVSGKVSASKSKSSDKKLKKLNYRFKEVSAMILRSKTPSAASRAVILARTRAALLHGKYATGMYDPREMESAIIHAESMVRIAKKKLKHLKQEQAVERGENAPAEAYEEPGEENEFAVCGEFGAENMDNQPSSEELERMLREMEREMKRLMQESMEQVEEAAGMDELAEELMAASGDMEPEDAELLKKKHRADELREITEADMKYLKAMFDRLQREKQSVQSSSGSRSPQSSQSPGSAQPEQSCVSLELGGADMPVSLAEAPVSAEGAVMDVTV